METLQRDEKKENISEHFQEYRFQISSENRFYEVTLLKNSLTVCTETTLLDLGAKTVKRSVEHDLRFETAEAQHAPEASGTISFPEPRSYKTFF